MTKFETNKFVFQKQYPSIKGSKSFIFPHHIASSSGSLQDVNTSWCIIFGSLSGNYISFSASTNKTNLLIGCFKIGEVKFDLFSLINNFTLQRTLFLSLLISKILSSGQLFGAASVWIKTISFVLKFFFSVVHFDLVWRVDRNYFLLHLNQNLSAKCCTLLHCLLLYKSGLTNEPSGGIITLLFIVNKLCGDNGAKLCGSLIVSTVRGGEFTIAWTSVIRVWRDSSFQHVP